MTREPVVDLVWFNAGGGHRAVFEVPQILEQILADQDRARTSIAVSSS